MTTTQTITIKPGETFTLPPGAELQFVSDPGGVFSECGDPPVTGYKCGFFFIILDADSNDGHSMDEQTTYKYVKVGDIQYDLNVVVTSGDSNHPTFTDISVLNGLIGDTTLFEFKAITKNEVTSRVHAHVFFRAPESFFDSIKLGIDNRGVNSIADYSPFESVCDDYPNPS